MEEHELLRRAALAVVRSIDHEASYYEAQSPVEDWALDALEAAVAVDLRGAESLLDRYDAPSGRSAVPTQSRNGTRHVRLPPALRTPADRGRSPALL